MNDESIRFISIRIDSIRMAVQYTFKSFLYVNILIYFPIYLHTPMVARRVLAKSQCSRYGSPERTGFIRFSNAQKPIRIFLNTFQTPINSWNHKNTEQNKSNERIVFSPLLVATSRLASFVTEVATASSFDHRTPTACQTTRTVPTFLSQRRQSTRPDLRWVVRDSESLVFSLDIKKGAFVQREKRRPIFPNQPSRWWSTHHDMNGRAGQGGHETRRFDLTASFLFGIRDRTPGSNR
jgi:hypothetical protein